MMVALALNVALATTLAAINSQDFHWQGRVASGHTLRIRGINGDIHASPASGAEVEVAARKHARRGDPSEVEIRVVEHEGDVTICTVYASSSSRDCDGRSSRSGSRDDDVMVDFDVKVPAGIRLESRSVNGGIEATALTGDVDAYTVNGSIRLSTKGLATAETVNGTIRASLGQSSWKDSLAFKTVNGDIDLDLPSTIGAEVRARTVNGGIQTDFPMTVQGRLRRLTHFTGTIGGGGRILSLETVNGNITLRKGT